jgi:hypothetical protein
MKSLMPESVEAGAVSREIARTEYPEALGAGQNGPVG